MHDALADQRAVLTDILQSERHSTAVWKAGPASAEEILDLHRQTIFGGLTNALGLIYPTVSRLVGADFFEHIAHQYVTSHPPHSPILSEYGEFFPEFIDASESCSSLPYLKDVAALDLAVDRVSHNDVGEFGEPVVLGGCAKIRLDLSLRCLAVDYPVDSIREAIERDREDLLPTIDMAPAKRYFSTWMARDGVRLRPVGAAAYELIRALHDAAGDAENSIEAASIDIGSCIESIQNDVLLAPYSRISIHTPESRPS